MAADPGSRALQIVLIVVSAATVYSVWQVAPLARRMDAIDRDRLEANDRLQREIESLRDSFERARFFGPTANAAPAARQPARPPAVAGAAVVAAPAEQAAPAIAATAAPPRVSITNAETFFNRRLLPEDAAIATLYVESLPVPEIARRLRHSTAYILAKGIQIEKQLSTAPDTPPEILAVLRAAVARAKEQR